MLPSQLPTRFDGLNLEKMYTIHVATELEGKTVVQVILELNFLLKRGLTMEKLSNLVSKASVQGRYQARQEGDKRETLC